MNFLTRTLLLLAVCAFGFAQAAEERNIAVQSGAGAEKRVALVIGNAAYRQGALTNPVNDARAISRKLRSLGFEVVLHENLKLRDIGGVYREFRSKITPGGVALVFYAGHGIQFKGQNYFPAIDADISSEEDVPLQSLNLGNLLDNMEEAKAGVSLVFLDACRDNPFARRFRSATRGLAKVEAASGMLIHYATRPGSVASDGEGQNGTYTEALLAQMSSPGVPVELMLKRVANQVVTKTKGKQEPWVEGSLRGDFYFISQGPTTVQVQQAPADPEGEAWKMAERTDSIEALEAYLREYPKGNYAAAARIRLAALKKTEGLPSPAPVQQTPTPAPSAFAQTKDQFFPVLTYRTGAYAPNGSPWANGFVDYLKLTNTRGGINGVKVIWEECEMGYATDRGVACYELLKGKHSGATVFHPLSRGVTFALTEKVLADKISLITAGYGRSESQNGAVFTWNFPFLSTAWTSVDVLVQHVANKEGGFDKLRGKKIALVFHDSPFGKESIAALMERGKVHGFDVQQIPVKHPGLEQKTTWLQIIQNKPDYVFLAGWGVMNHTAIKEAQATGYPREKMYGALWAGAEPDVKGLGDDAKGYNAVAMQHGAGHSTKVVQEILSTLHARGLGTGPKEEVGDVYYMRGIVSAMLSIEGVRAAQGRYGKGQWVTSEQARWGFENINLDQRALDSLGFAGVMRPVRTNCIDHMGSGWERIHTWDGRKWNVTSDWYQADANYIRPMVMLASTKYAQDKRIVPRTPQDCNM